jgi:hypothetical protein
MLSTEKPGPEPFDYNGQYVLLDQLDFLLSPRNSGASASTA